MPGCLAQEVCIGRASGPRLAFTVVVRDTPQRRFEAGGRLLLDLVREGVDLEPVQSGMNRSMKMRLKGIAIETAQLNVI